MAVVSEAAVPLGDPAAAKAGWRPTLWQIWLALSIFLLLVNVQDVLASRAPEPDDYLRLSQVRDWLAGQSWFDSRQYRMNPPFGADIHWVRLVDLPIAAFILFFRLFLSAPVAETAAMVAVPLAQLFVGMVVLRALMRRLGQTNGEIRLAMIVIPLMPLLIFNFMPMRIDHHGWQAIAALTMVWLLIRQGYREAFLGGAVAAVLLFISVEGMPMVAIIAGLYALRYWRYGVREHEGYLLGLALGGPVLFVILRPLGDFGTAYCDMLSWPHFLAFGASALVILASRLVPGQDRPGGRLLAMMPIPLVAAPAMIVPLGICAVSPMAKLDPLLKTYWFDNLLESAPIWREYPSVVGMLLASLAQIAVGAWLANRRWAGTERWESWLYLSVASLGAALISLIVMRAAITVQLLALPFSALILSEILPRAQAIRNMIVRVVATAGCFVIATPALASGALKLLDAKTSYTLVSHPKLGLDGMCTLDKLKTLPRAMIFNSLDLGAEIVARTPHSVVMGGYHRNQAKMLEIFHAFGGPIDQARAIIRANHADYLVTCTSSADLAAYANMGKDNLADRIFDGNVPDWLERIPDPNDRALRLYRVK